MPFKGCESVRFQHPFCKEQRPHAGSICAAPAFIRPCASGGRRADFSHRQLRRHLHPGVSGGQGSRAQPRTDGVLGLVGIDRRGGYRAISQLGEPRAHYYGLVDTRRGFSGGRVVHHALRRGNRCLHDFSCCIRPAGVVRLLRKTHSDDSSRRRCRPAGGDLVAVRYRCVWRHEC